MTSNSYRVAKSLRAYKSDDENAVNLGIEDDPIVRELVEQTLQPTGYCVTYAENGREAKKALEYVTPDLIMINLMMHTMDGIEFLEHLRLSERLHEVPVIVLTASDIGEEQQLRLKGCVDSVFQKGLYKKEDLLKAICALAEQHRSGAKPDVKSWLIRHAARPEAE